jgi:hypothetical protein
MRAGRLAAARQDFARLTLGMFAASFPASPLTFSYAGEAEAPQGKADVIDVRGEGFTGRFFVDRASRLPLMVSWMAPAGGPPPGAGGPPRPAAGGPPPPGQPPRLVEHRLYYGDYREVSGLKLPFRLRRAVDGNTVEETTFDNFRINPRIDARKFEVRP